MDSRDVLEKEASDGVARPWSCELRFPRRNKDARMPMRLASELRRRAEARLEMGLVSTGSTVCREPLFLGSNCCSAGSMGVCCANLSEMSSGNWDMLDGPRACPGPDTLPREYRTAFASDTTGSSKGLSSGVGSWLFSCVIGVMGSGSGRFAGGGVDGGGVDGGGVDGGGVEGRTSSMGTGASFSMPRPTASAARCFSARRSSLRRRRSVSALVFFSRRRLSRSMISRNSPASSESARSSIRLVRLFWFWFCARPLRGLRWCRGSVFSLEMLGDVRSP